MTDRRDPTSLGHTRLDTDRTRRIGLPEAIYASGKSVEQCVEIVATLLTEGNDPIVVTRTDEAQRKALAALAPDESRGTTLTWRHAPPLGRAPVAVISGGTSDQPVVDECHATLEAHGAEIERRVDVGVAGVQRLLDVVPDIAHCSVVVAVAGMEASLPTVVAGLVGAPIIAVPTSTGYGASLQGVTASLSVLASCSPGITMVGIDNGYGAACAALRILRGN